VGLLAALRANLGELGEAPQEFEYRLLSWGELYPGPAIVDLGSGAARWILADWPFKLFRSSDPDQIPQRLCLQFRLPSEPGAKYIDYDRVASELAAFLSVVTRRRVVAEAMTRRGDLPEEHPIHLYGHSYWQPTQAPMLVDSRDVIRLLEAARRLPETIGTGLVLALRLYHSAVQMLYSETDMAYLLLMMSLEAVSGVVIADYRLSDDGPLAEEEYLDNKFAGWKALMQSDTAEERKRIAAILTANERFVKRKLLRFVRCYTPPQFFTQDLDDAKPDYVHSVVMPDPAGLGTERVQRSSKRLGKAERIDAGELESMLDTAYDRRSQFVHAGRPFPRGIAIGFPRIPGECLEEMINTFAHAGGHKVRYPAIPTLLTLDRLVSACLIGYLRSQTTD